MIDMTDNKRTIDRVKDCDVIYWYDLTDVEMKDFDYHDTEESQEGASFARYFGDTYDLSEFMRNPGMFPDEWQGYFSNGLSFGILCRFTDDGESVTLATYY